MSQVKFTIYLKLTPDILGLDIARYKTILVIKFDKLKM